MAGCKSASPGYAGAISPKAGLFAVAVQKSKPTHTSYLLQDEGAVVPSRQTPPLSGPDLYR